MKKNFTIKTIGCKVNTYESMKIRDELIKSGFNYIDVEEKEKYNELDFYIVNTCSVTKIADKKSRQMLHLAKKYNPNVLVIAIGCMVDSLSVEADNIHPFVGANAEAVVAKHCNTALSGVDYLINNQQKSHFVEFLLSLLESQSTPVEADTIPPFVGANEEAVGAKQCEPAPVVENTEVVGANEEVVGAKQCEPAPVAFVGAKACGAHICTGELCEPAPVAFVGAKACGAHICTGELCEPAPVSSPPSTCTRNRAFIKIQDGCNQYCSYCIIPFLRGNIKSRSNEEIINEIKEMVSSGIKEIVLTGIHLSSFGLDRVNKTYESIGAIDIARKELITIMTQISEIEGLDRIRLGSLEPRIINDYFLSSVSANLKSLLSTKFCASFCLSLQSGSDKTLKRMNRHYTTKDFENACQLIRKYLPYATITTDVIVGFPGETEEDFEESLDFVKRMRFYNPNIFPFSRRQGTKADKMPNQIKNEEKHRRVVLMIKECEKISKEIEKEYFEKYKDKALDLLIEETIEENGIKYGVGYTKEYIKCKVRLLF